MSSLCILGLGVVGIPQTVAFDSGGHDVVGFDIDEQKIERLKNGEDPNEELPPERIQRSGVTFTDDPGSIESVDYVIVTVSTPIDEWKRPDLSTVAAAGEMVGENLSPGTTVVLESTVYPGATREVLIPAVERGSDLRVGNGFSVGYSPERISPNVSGFEQTTKIVSGLDDATRSDLASLYESVVEAGVHLAPSIEAAEAAKCLENVQRDVNIALVNEFAMGCGELDIDLDPREVLEAAQTKWNFHEYEPGLVGGHCIPVDPYFLISRFERDGFDPDLMRTARATNDRYPKFVADTVVKKLAAEVDAAPSRVRAPSRGETDGVGPSERPQVLVLGVAYKPNTNDPRNEPLHRMIDELERYGVDVDGFDPHVPNDVIGDEFDIPAVEDPDFSGYDALVVTTSHEEFQDLDLGSPITVDGSPVLVDLSGMFSNRTERGEYVAPTYRV